MVTIYVNGIRLDSLKETEMAFKWTNPLFSFDNLQISRTQEFTLPRTPRNDNALGFAAEVQQYGQMMRQSVAAVVMCEGIQISGYLVISEVTAKGYKAVLTYGELSKLAEIKAAGSIADYLQLNDFLTMDGSLITPADFNFAEYDNGENGTLTGIRFPSVNVDYLMDQCASHFGVSIGSGLDATELKIVLNTLNGDGYTISTDTVTLGTDGKLTGFNANLFTPSTVTLDYNVVPTLRCTTACKIRFTGSNPYTPGSAIPGTQALLEYRSFMVLFNGGSDYESHDNNIDAEVELKVGAHVMFADSIYFPDEMGHSVTRAYPSSAQTYTMTLTGVSGTTTWGGLYYLQPNLPDVTFLDLLKSVAAINNRALAFDGTTLTAISYDTAWSGAPENIDTKFIEWEKIERKVGSYAQDNAVVYDAFDNAPTDVLNFTEQHYYINNTTLEKRKELLKHKFAQGLQTTSTVPLVRDRYTLRIPSTEVKEVNGQMQTVLKGFSKPVLARADRTVHYEVLLLIKATKSQALQDVCTLATHAVCKVLMPLYKFVQIGTSTLYYLRGCVWCVESAEWSKGVARLYLQRVR